VWLVPVVYFAWFVGFIWKQTCPVCPVRNDSCRCVPVWIEVRNVGVGNGDPVFFVSPVFLLLFSIDIDRSILISNLGFIVVPFLVGLISRNYDNSVVQDLKLHFSKLSFWLIVTITLIQARLLYINGNLLDVSVVILSSVVFLAFIVMSYGYSHLFSRMLGLYEKEARSIGYISSTKNVGLALFLAAQISGEVILLVCLYYFIRQLTGLAVTDLHLHGESKLSDRVGF